MTPIWEDDANFNAAQSSSWRSLYVVGKSDPTHVAERHRQLAGETVEVDGANHSLEIEGDVVASVDALATVTRAVLRFVEP